MHVINSETVSYQQTLAIKSGQSFLKKSHLSWKHECVGVRDVADSAILVAKEYDLWLLILIIRLGVGEEFRLVNEISL